MKFPEISLFNTKITTSNNNQTSGQTPRVTYKSSQSDTFESKNNETSDKKPWYIACGIAILGVAAYVVNTIRKPSHAKQAQKLVKQLIKQLKPKDVELAKEFYPIIHKNAQVLNLKPENYNKVMSCLNKDNKEFMLQEGIDLITSKYEKLKEVLAEPVEDVCNLIKSLNKKNTPIFNTVTGDIKKFQILDVEDVTKYLTELNPEKYDYMFNKLMPKISENAEALKLGMADRIIKTLNHITPETEDLIPRLAKKYPNEGKISKYTILINSTKDNKECAVSFVKNSGKLDIGTDEIVARMKTLTNDNAKSIDTVANNIETLKLINNASNKKRQLSDLFKLTKGKAEIADTVLQKTDSYKITNFDDLEQYLKNIPEDKLEFMENTIMPKLQKYGDVLGIEHADYITDIVKYLNPKTAKSIDLVAKYAKKIGRNDLFYYPAFFSGVNEKNMKNIPIIMEKISKDPETWASNISYKKVFNSIK